MDALTDFRQRMDQFMAQHPQSPLDEEQRAEFAGLPYYPENPALLLEVTVELFDAGEPMIEMETSTGDIRPFRRYGRFAFSVHGQEVALTIYGDADEQDFFLPFKDKTNGAETYGAGRYLDNHRPGLMPMGDGRFQINFNYAYNPYCAYSPYYSCPLPPRENWLPVPIEAGEKAFPTHLE
jgi:uncharacterized protein (DUF1684 family)